MEFIRENMETEQLLSARPTQTAVETEAALPGGLREETRVFFADAQAAVRGGELMGNRITAEGKVTFHVLYAQGDLSHISALEASAEFSQPLPLKEENAQRTAARVMPRAEVQHVSAKAFNGRLLLRAIVQLTAEAALPRTISYIKDVAGEDGVQRAVQTLSLQRAVGEGQAQNLLKEEFELSSALQIKETLYATAQAQVEDILGGADGRATVTGTLSLEAYHASALPGRPLLRTRHTMPFEQSVGLSGALGDALAARSEVRDVAVLSQEGGEGRTLRAEVLLDTEITALADAQQQTLRDVFTTAGNALETRAQHVLYRTGAVQEQTAESGKTALLLPEGSPRVQEALLAFIRPLPVKAERQGGKLAMEGILEVTLIYQTEDNPVPVSLEQEEPFHAVFATQAEPEDALTLTAEQVEPSVLTGDRVELKYILRLRAEGVRKAGADVIVEAEETAAPPEKRGVALYFLQPGESLWEVAKRYRVAPSALETLNPGLSEDAPAGTPVITYKR